MVLKLQKLQIKEGVQFKKKETYCKSLTEQGGMKHKI